MARWHAANPAASQPGSSSSSSSEDESDEDSGSTSSIDSEIKSDDSDVAIVRRHDHHRKKGNGLLTAADLPLDVRQAAWESADPVALERALHREACSRGNQGYADPSTGLFVFTKIAHSKRPCCGNGCRHCPYLHSGVPSNRRDEVASLLIVDDW